jgi:hypothetical protein
MTSSLKPRHPVPDLRKQKVISSLCPEKYKREFGGDREEGEIWLPLLPGLKERHRQIEQPKKLPE